MVTPNVTLIWNDTNGIEVGHKIYRSEYPMSTDNMPPPIDIVDRNIERYVDENVISGNFYYYRVSAYAPNSESYSDEIYTEAKVPFGPGSQELIGGDMTAGFFGEVPPSEFITGDDLATSIGLTTGVSQYSDTSWLKFTLDDEILYVPKKPIRHSVSWEDIYQAGAVYGTDDNGLHPSGGDRIQDARVTIDGFEFKVTLMKGGNVDPIVASGSSYDASYTHISEWNRLMYPIHSGIHTNSSNPGNPSVPYAQWASYSDEELLAYQAFGDGGYNMVQENRATSASCFVRGYNGITFTSYASVSNAFNNYGWRPALRLV